MSRTASPRRPWASAEGDRAGHPASAIAALGSVRRVPLKALFRPVTSSAARRSGGGGPRARHRREFSTARLSPIACSTARAGRGVPEARRRLGRGARDLPLHRGRARSGRTELWLMGSYHAGSRLAPGAPQAALFTQSGSRMHAARGGSPASGARHWLPEGACHGEPRDTTSW
jgi:hypothetical protein